MSSDAAFFEGALRKFAERTEIRMDLVVRKVTFDFYAAIVQRTPVDTGRARGNWFVNFAVTDEIDNTIGENAQRARGGLFVASAKQRAGYKKAASKDAQGTASMARAAGFLSNVKAGGVVYIFNNVPYIMKLEYGSSTQAPQGMARITVAEFQRYVNEVLRSL